MPGLLAVTAFDDLPTLADRPRMAVPKGKTRLQDTVAQRPLTKVDAQQFKAAVWARDLYHCRCCLRAVIRTPARIPERGEVNHIHGRTGDLRFEVRAALLLCLTCHERVTGRVNSPRLVIVPSQTFTIRQGTFTDATHPVSFVEAA